MFLSVEGESVAGCFWWNRSPPADVAYSPPIAAEKLLPFLVANLASGRRSNGDASGLRVPSPGGKPEELLQQHGRKVHRQQDHWPRLRSRDTGGRKEPRGRCLGVRMLVERDRGLALGARPENERVAPRCSLGMLMSLSARVSPLIVTLWRSVTQGKTLLLSCGEWPEVGSNFNGREHKLSSASAGSFVVSLVLA